MIPALLGVPGKLKTLIDLWTSTKAGYVDAAVTSRAPASTALSTAVWSSGLATELDGLAPSIAAIPTTPINSIQYGEVTINTSSTSGTATITAVTTAKTVLIYLGCRTDATTITNANATLTLTNTTTITATRTGNGNTLIVRFVAVEFK